MPSYYRPLRSTDDVLKLFIGHIELPSHKGRDFKNSVLHSDCACKH